ncbi:tyrosine-protein phosphatase [Pseudooceanicola aestuarii]|uniref:tyrosine-protein phosphatase n=1 Tax=Pseudooceanicola aestuarii TaxID=2697319 RepID=UPI0013D71575|nr:tyrosine-protein phosphatase [Pseudooceanicola aestuarii]
MPEITRLPYAGAHNMRCLGGHPLSVGGVTRADAIWRGDALQDLSAEDLDAARARGLRRIIDLRRDTEIDAAPNPLADVAGVTYLNIPLFDGLAPIDHLPRAHADEFDIGARYRMALDDCGANIARTLRAIAEVEDDGIAYFHCTAGKDRTGLTAALLLENAGVARQDVIAEYALTSTLGASLMEVLRTHIEGRGNSPERTARILSSDPATMERTLDHLDTQHGGAATYLETIGLDRAERVRLREMLGG